MIKNLECPKCGYVGRFEVGETENPLVFTVRCSNCNHVDKGALFKEIPRAPRSLTQIIRSIKADARYLGKELFGKQARHDAWYELRYSFTADGSTRTIRAAGWIMTVLFFAYFFNNSSISKLIESPDALIGRNEIFNLCAAIGILALGIKMFLLRKSDP